MLTRTAPAPTDAPSAPKKETAKVTTEAPAAPAVHFARASRRRREPIYSEVDTLTSSAIPHNSLEVPANGFLRHLVLLVTATGGDNGNATVAAKADAPFSVLQEVTFSDINGSPIVAPLSGYELYLYNKYGAYAFAPDPKQNRSFEGVDTDGNFQFLIRIPLEISLRDAFGALPNQNASQTYKWGYTLAPSTDVYTTPPDTLPSVRVRAWTETWAAPARQNAQGAEQSQVPPDLGVVQFMSRQVHNVAAVGEQTIRHSRVGQAIRNIIYVGRDASGVRSDSVFPTEARLTLDTSPLDNVPQSIIRSALAEAYGFDAAVDVPGGLDTGVFVWQFTDDFDGHPGNEMRDQWLPTTGATRLELQGAFAATGTLTILTNDIGRPG